MLDEMHLVANLKDENPARPVAQVESLMQVGGAARHVSATAMNEHSSRSHLIFTIYTTSKHRTTGAHPLRQNLHCESRLLHSGHARSELRNPQSSDPVQWQ